MNFTLPQVVLARLEDSKEFFLGSFEEVFKYTLVTWDKVCGMFVDGGRWFGDLEAWVV